ncbi:hypothetical protein [Nocardioides euryhalodurans]|uniref:Alpha/beta hydrolase n=1 Tax=Nocardioides euryhalodurans TaxID=2518370 RepID=A0A4P7GJC7_9ACTN|nr:hypothetical protein [Nocardioides euryhalodurans]QBR92110.1 hypothetical protein EXE57_07315 [Nocardioides euryhalodurans]
MPPHLLVLPSPFLGPAAYGPVVAALSSLGLGASVADVPADPEGACLVDAWSAAARGVDDVVLVPHSNAGYLAPTVSAAAGGAPVVFVDAALPVTTGSTTLAPPAFREHLAALAGPDGRLPRWTRWWPRADVAAVLPGPLLEDLDSLLPEVPLSYVDGEVPVPPGWQAGARAYLALGTTYAEELAVARAHRWPTRVLDDAGHLHLLVDPGETARVVADLLDALRLR